MSMESGDVRFDDPEVIDLLRSNKATLAHLARTAGFGANIRCDEPDFFDLRIKEGNLRELEHGQIDDSSATHLRLQLWIPDKSNPQYQSASYMLLDYRHRSQDSTPASELLESPYRHDHDARFIAYAPLEQSPVKQLHPDDPFFHLSEGRVTTSVSVADKRRSVAIPPAYGTDVQQEIHSETNRLVTVYDIERFLTHALEDLPFAG